MNDIPIRVCTCDNPATMRRVCWRNGVLMCSYRYDILAPFAKEPIPSDLFFFGANIGPWTPGQVIGDLLAMPPETQQELL